MRRITKLFVTKATSVNEGSKTIRFKISDNQIDRMGEIVDQKTWDFKNYQNNPVVFWGHESREPEYVLGTTQSLDVEPDGSATYATLRLDEDINPKANLVWQQLKRGTLRCVSVGFMNKSEEMQDSTPVLKDNELLEISIVPIPANPRAVALAYKEGTLSKKDAEWLIDSYKKEASYLEEQVKQDNSKENTMDEQTNKQLSALLDAVTKLATAQASTNERLESLITELKVADDELVVKDAIRSNLPLADEALEWDAAAAIKHVKDWASNDNGDIDFSKYRKAFFWVDADNADKQGGYKLPFADVVDGELKAIWSGVAAAHAAVDGARGGVEGVDKDAVLTQIKKYYKKFDKPWPTKAMATEDIKTKDANTDAEGSQDQDSVDKKTADAGEKTKEEPKVDPAKGGSDDQPGAVSDDEIDLEVELTPELEERISAALEPADVTT